MSEHLRLAVLCEESFNVDRTLELDVWRLNGGTCPPGKTPLAWLHCYTSSVDAALALCDETDASDVMREALGRIGARFSLHIRRWPEDVSYRNVLARFVTAACLRLLAAAERSRTGEDIDLRYIELDDAHIRVANTFRSLEDNEISGSERDKRPMGRVWQAIVDMLVRDERLAANPGPATEEMVRAGQAAYDRKNDDRWSPTPTEDPEAGGGPVGYAWRAMAAVYSKGTGS